MTFQNVFKRYELKYMLTTEQKQQLVARMEPYMQLDKFGRTTIRNLYYDTNDYLLVRRSVEKPFYKEKLRIRSYCRAEAESPVFVELKKKYDSVVYKRRIALPEQQAMAWTAGECSCTKKSQISNEIDYFLSYYQNLHPAVYLSYEREAYYCKDGSDFRVTFDDTVLCRQEDLSLCSEAYGTQILPKGKVLLELKCSGGIPLWMTNFLSEERIYKTSFSKYGTAYETLIFPQLQQKNDPKEKIFHAG